MDRGMALLAGILIGALGGTAQGEPGTTLHVDASRPTPAAVPAAYTGGSSRAPDGALWGSTIGVTDRYLTRDGRPWVPVMGELHYSRVPRAQWEDAILQMKAAGVSVISTYVFWIHQEEVQGVWDWSGQRDLRAFAQLCAKHGMLLYPRLGPWAHGEARNGGLPDWVMEAGPVRQLDPAFMTATKELYRQIGQQLDGMLWKQGGPVIGVQIENEYSMRGPGKGEAYMLALKKLAVASGIDVPLYSVTGWDGAAVPAGEFLPVYGGYPDAPWGASRTALPAPEVYAFRFGGRVSGNMGMLGATSAAKPAAQQTSVKPALPFLTAEMGGGIEDTYHRRPLVSADDIAAMMPVMLGSGVNGYGTYMFRGGQNPDGVRSTLEESQATHYPTDVPVKSYDFQAPIAESGLERPSLRRIKQWNYFLDDFGALLAPMPAFAPELRPKDPAELSTLRWSVRTDGHAGFVFVNNYVRGATMAAHPQVQFAISLPGGRSALVPQKPVDVPAGAYFAWPFGMDLGGLPLRYATAQLLTRLKAAPGEDPTYAFACVAGIRCELVFDDARLEASAATELGVKRSPESNSEQSPERHLNPRRHGADRSGTTVLTRPEAAPEDVVAAVRLRTAAGNWVRLLLLSPAQAMESWKVQQNGRDWLVRTSADLFADDTTITLRQLNDDVFHFALEPAPATPPDVAAAPGAARAVQAANGGEADGHGFAASVAPLAVAIAATPLRPAGTAPPVHSGPPLSWRPTGVAQAPEDAAWAAAAAAWSLETTPSPIRLASLPSSVSDLFLDVRYTADEARLLTGGRLLEDDFFNGVAWQVSLRQFSSGGSLPPLTLQMLPMRADAPVYLEAAARARIANTGQTLALDSVRLVPQYQLRISGLSPAGKR